MSRSMGLWRVRRSPLRRRSYAVEAWALLAVGVVTAAGAVTAGAAVADEVRHQLAQQRAQRHPTTAVLTQDPSAQAGYASDRFAQVAWTAVDGTRHTARTEVGAAQKSGDQVGVWTDSRGQLTPAPLDAPAARLAAAAEGGATGLGVCAMGVLGCGIAVRLGARRRAGQWAAEWTVVGPQWDRRKA